MTSETNPQLQAARKAWWTHFWTRYRSEVPLPAMVSMVLMTLIATWPAEMPVAPWFLIALCVLGIPVRAAMTTMRRVPEWPTSEWLRCVERNTLDFHAAMPCPEPFGTSEDELSEKMARG